MSDDVKSTMDQEGKPEAEGASAGPQRLSVPLFVRGETRPEKTVGVVFRPRGVESPDSEQLWQAIRFHTEQVSFPEFQDFVVRALVDNQRGSRKDEDARIKQLDPLNQFNLDRYARSDASCDVIGTQGYAGFIPGVDLYSVLKTAAEIFLLLRCGICPPSPKGAEGKLPQNWWKQDIFDTEGSGGLDPDTLQTRLTQFLGEDRSSYIRGIIRNVFQDSGFKSSPFAPISVGFGPCLMELIWSYWLEEGMQVQTINAVALRFQNVRLGRGRDPLVELVIDPLRPLSGFLWGYIQDEPHRLSVARRAYEYSHQYGLNLYGKAVQQLQPADVRSRFLEAFHDLLTLTSRFYQETADNTVTPDGFPLLVALRDLHLILAEGAHNQFRDLAWTARVEMLVQQWLLARPEMRDFLRGRLMVPYPEGWMGAVDAMKRLQGWTDTNIIHFRDLAVLGERLLLSVRHVAWNEVADPAVASDWALFWRPEVQGYIHAYRMATGVSLSDDAVEVRRANDGRYRQPSYHLRTRLASARRESRQIRGVAPGDDAPRQLNPPSPEAGIPNVPTTRTRA